MLKRKHLPYKKRTCREYATPEERKQAQREAQKRYRDAHREKLREKSRKYEAENRDNRRLKDKQYDAEHREERKQKARDRRVNFPERTREIEKRSRELNAVARRLQHMKYSAKRRDIPVKIGDDDFTQLFITKPCHYCGHSSTLNGADRVDSNGIYELSNCVPCCRMCNLMKRRMHVDTFIRACKHIEKWIRHKQPCIDSKNAKRKRDLMDRYDYWKKGADKRDIEWKLTMEEFKCITSMHCVFCGYNNGYTGIDRWDNSGDYTMENCEPACSRCNMMKSVFDGHAFIEKCLQIVDNLE
jgi:hypothetical protein